MKVYVKAKPGAKEERVDPASLELWQEKKNSVPENENWITVWVKEPSVQGRANAAITKALADFFRVPFSHVRLISGFSSKQKYSRFCE